MTVARVARPDLEERAPFGRMLAAQTALELRLTLRRGESVLVTLVIPAALLLFFAYVPVAVDAGRLGGGSGRPFASTGVLLPGMLSLAVMSTAMVSLGIATAFERSYGVLKRLGGTPLTRPALLGAKLLSVLAVEALQVALLAGVALASGWRPEGNLLLALGAILLGTAAFGGLGLWMAGSWRAEATLAGANGLYVLLLLLGGIVVPVQTLPGVLAAVGAWLPSAALADVLRVALFPELAAARLFPALAVLVAWAILAPALAVRTFKWE